MLNIKLVNQYPILANVPSRGKGFEYGMSAMPRVAVHPSNRIEVHELAPGTEWAYMHSTSELVRYGANNAFPIASVLCQASGPVHQQVGMPEIATVRASASKWQPFATEMFSRTRLLVTALMQFNLTKTITTTSTVLVDCEVRAFPFKTPVYTRSTVAVFATINSYAEMQEQASMSAGSIKRVHGDVEIEEQATVQAMANTVKHVPEVYIEDTTATMWASMPYMNNNTYQAHEIVTVGAETPVILFDGKPRLWLDTQECCVYP